MCGERIKEAREGASAADGEEMRDARKRVGRVGRGQGERKGDGRGSRKEGERNARRRERDNDTHTHTHTHTYIHTYIHRWLVRGMQITGGADVFEPASKPGRGVRACVSPMVSVKYLVRARGMATLRIPRERKRE